MKVYAVIDTNVLVSAILSKKEDSATRRVARAMLTGDIKVLYNKEIFTVRLSPLARS